ncbi:MAG: HepT-like ribonuclease domain-containing protein [Candidatus Bathyarchaeia archaeon]
MEAAKKRETFIQMLREVLAKFGEIKFACLFGSYCEDRAMPASDLDMAVLTGESRVIPYLTAELSRVLGIPEEEVSVLNLEDAGPILKLKVLSRGVRLLDRGMYGKELMREIEPETVDLLENERESFRAWLKGNPLDESLLKRILTQLSEDTEDLKEFLKKDPERVRLDKNLRKAFERTMQTSIKGAIDLLRHVILGLNLGVAEYYKDYVEISKGKGVISMETAENLLELIPTRHTLVHRYREVDYQKLMVRGEENSGDDTQATG